MHKINAPRVSAARYLDASISQYLDVVPQYNPAVGMFGSTDIVASADGLANTQQIFMGAVFVFKDTCVVFLFSGRNTSIDTLPSYK